MPGSSGSNHSFKDHENDDDQNIAKMAIKNSSFMKAVLDNIG